MTPELVRPIEILLVEDNPGDVRLTIEALKEAKVINNLTVLKDGEAALALSPPSRTLCPSEASPPDCAGFKPPPKRWARGTR